MKKISFWATMLAMLVVCGLSVTSCSKDDKEETNGGGGKQQTYSLDDYVYKYWTRCERVGANLVIEMVFENISDNNIYGAKLALVNGAIKDNLGNTYYVNTYDVTLASATDINSISNYTQEWQTLNIPAGRAVAYFVKIKDFDPSNRATKVSFDATFSVSSGLPATTYTINTSTLPIEDRRVMEKGIQTNDTALVYKVTNCERVGSVLQIDFTVTNNSAIEMGNLTFGTPKDATDDLGNSYYYRDNLKIAFEDGFYKSEYQIRVKPNETAHGRIRITGFDSTNKAKSVTVPIQCISDTYKLTDDIVRFLTIPIRDYRVLYDGIQTPDLNIVVKLQGTEVDDDNNLTIKYTIKNNTGETLQNFAVGVLGNAGASDDLSNQYYWRDNMYVSLNGSDFGIDTGYNSTAYNGSGFYGKWRKTTIPDGETVDAAVKIKDFAVRANNVTFILGVSSDNYEPADNKIHFITIPVQR